MIILIKREWEYGRYESLRKMDGELKQKERKELQFPQMQLTIDYQLMCYDIMLYYVLEDDGAPGIKWSSKTSLYWCWSFKEHNEDPSVS